MYHGLVLFGHIPILSVRLTKLMFEIVSTYPLFVSGNGTLAIEIRNSSATVFQLHETSPSSCNCLSFLDENDFRRSVMPVHNEQ